MRQKAKLLALTAITLANSLSAPASLADPLHKAGNEGAYRHEDSGWLFPKQIGDFSRVTPPYTIDGNNDVGVEYQSEAQAAAVIEIYAIDSAAAGAKLESAKSSAALKAGTAAKLESEEPFQLEARDDLRAVEVTYASAAKSPQSLTRLYFIESERWIVKVLVSTQASGPDAGKTLDAFVQSLPWKALGIPGDLH